MTFGAAARRGPLRPGDRVQLTDARGHKHTITLTPGEVFHTHRGYFKHDELLGSVEGTVVTTTAGIEYVAMRPLLSDFVMSMPRGPQVVYPKDAAQIVTYADIFPGAVVFEAGLGSGALALSLLRAVGENGRLISVERRSEFAEIAQANVTAFFGGRPPSWTVEIGDAADVLLAQPPASVDRVVFDMLAPWENLAAVSHALVPGGVFICYVATVTQLSRLVEDLRSAGQFTEPTAWESSIRTWHLNALAVRPDHRMVAHTGFLVRTRLMAPGVMALTRRTRPAPGAHDEAGLAETGWADATWSEEAIGMRPISEKALRRTIRRLEVSRAPEADRAPEAALAAEADPGPEADQLPNEAPE